MDQASGFPFPSTPGPRHKRTLFHPPSQASAPELHLVGTKTTTKRQLNDLSSQVKSLDLSTPGGSSYSNLISHFSDLSNQLLHIIHLFTSPFFFLPVQLVFPVLVHDYVADNKTRKTSECSLYVGQNCTENDKRGLRLPKKVTLLMKPF
ncbi:hypothetical protein ILYODFUR_012426 [Ilyodon furcidens]|uniref:Uncharacterized protein n=1 Tax=Ilyodon furcidens TaxID=33524 RepID=A0ABV0SKN1_9TELE